MRDELHRALVPVRRRLRLVRGIKGAAWGLLAGGCACLGLMVLSFFMPLPGREKLQGFLLAACCLGAGLIAFAWPLSEKRAARAADACGLQERAQTALSLRGRQDAMSLLQRQDACRTLNHLNVRKIPINPPWKALAGCGGALLVAVALLLAPNPQVGEAARLENFARAMEEAAQTAQEAQEALESSLSQEKAQQLRKLLGDLSRELRQAKDSREAYLALNEAQERLESLRNSIRSSTWEALAEAGLESLATALESGNDQALQSAAQALMENAGESAQALETAAAGLSGADAQALQAAVSALSMGDVNALQNALSSLSAAQLSQALQNAQALLSQLRTAAGASGVQAAQGQQGQGQGASGQGEGEGSTGAGRGHTNEDQGYTEDTGRQRGEGQAAPQYREADYEAIYDPTRLDAADTPIRESGTRGEGDSLQLQTGPDLGTAEGSVPYRAVAGEYRQAAVQAMSGLSLPVREREWVDDYFSAITE